MMNTKLANEKKANSNRSSYYIAYRMGFAHHYTSITFATQSVQQEISRRTLQLSGLLRQKKLVLLGLPDNLILTDISL